MQGGSLACPPQQSAWRHNTEGSRRCPRIARERRQASVPRSVAVTDIQAIMASVIERNGKRPRKRTPIGARRLDIKDRPARERASGGDGMGPSAPARRELAPPAFAMIVALPLPLR